MTHTILVMAGGTGGHVFPALAVADDLRARGWRVVWLGARNGMEATLVPQRGYEMRWVRFSGLRGKGLLRAFMLPVNLLVAFWQCARAIREVRPEVVLGMGGYISFPGGMMAALFNRPLVIHEQNSVAGLANRVLAQVADRVLSGFPEVIKNGHWVGNPVRLEIASLPAPEVRYDARTGPLRVLVVGGSLGAQALNEALPAGLALIPADQRPSVVHQSGRSHIEALRAAYTGAGVSAEAVDFIDDMAKVYGNSDLVICRAGALTCAELAAAGVASVLVPLPHAVDDHQTTNARFLEQAGAAVLLPQKELNAARLADLLRSFTRAQLLTMAQRARGLARPQATREVAGICEGMAA